MKKERAQELYNWTLQRRPGMGEKRGKLPDLKKIKVGEILTLEESDIYVCGTPTPGLFSFICTKDVLGIRRNRDKKVGDRKSKCFTVSTEEKLYTIYEHTAYR